MEFSETLILKIKQIKALILDMDGVLVDTEPLHMEAFRRYLKKLNLPHDDAFIFGFIGYSVSDNVRAIFQRFFENPTEKDIARGIEKRDAIYLQLLQETPLHPLPGIQELVEFCQNKNIRRALASSSDRYQIQIIFQNLKQTTKGIFNPDQIFEMVLSGEDVHTRKPHPAIYLKMVELLNVRPSEVLAIEDSPAGVKSAKSAGLTCLAVRSRFIAAEKLTKADAVLNSAFDALKLCKIALA